MRDAERISRILELVERIWRASPDLRLMQLLGNCHGLLGDAYRHEDDELERQLRASIERIEWARQEEVTR